MKNPQDQHIIEALQKGGNHAEHAFMKLDKEMRPIIYGYLQQRFSNLSRTEHEDIIQETWIKVFNKIRNGEFRGDSSLKNWVMPILKNTTIDFFRTNNIYGKNLQSFHAEQNLDTSKPDFDDNPEVDQCIQEALHAYRIENPCSYADLLLTASGELNCKELATMLDKPYGATRQHLTAARKKIKKYIEQFCEKQK